MKTVCVIVGTSGEYDSHREWLVVAYLDEQEANTHLSKAQNWAHRSFQAHIAKGEDQSGWNPKQGSNPWDPNMFADYTGCNYFIRKVELFESINEYVLQRSRTG